jgi:DNA-binding response OmpR family regulator
MTDPKKVPATAILLIEEDQFLFNTYVMKFQQAGFNVHGCVSVAEGLQTLRDGFPAQAILFEIAMHTSDGQPLLEAMKKENLGAHAAKIALANDISEEQKVKINELGVGRCIIKASTMPSEVIDCAREEIAKVKK